MKDYEIKQSFDTVLNDDHEVFDGIFSDEYFAEKV